MHIVIAEADIGQQSDDKPKMVRRSTRIKQIGENNDKKTETKQKKRRRRYNSVMDDSNEDDDSEEASVQGVRKQEQERREPEHRHLNRMRLQRENIEPVLSPEDKPSFSQEINKEKTLVEIFLRKYGFGHWQLPNSNDDGTVKRSFHSSFLSQN